MKTQDLHLSDFQASTPLSAITVKDLCPLCTYVLDTGMGGGARYKHVLIVALVQYQQLSTALTSLMLTTYLHVWAVPDQQVTPLCWFYLCCGFCKIIMHST